MSENFTNLDFSVIGSEKEDAFTGFDKFFFIIIII